MKTSIEAAGELGVAPSTLRRQAAAGRIVATKLGRDWFVDDAAIAAYDRRRQPRCPWRHGRLRCVADADHDGPHQVQS